MNVRAWIAELVGTFALIFIGVGAIAANHMAGEGGTLVGVALAHGLTIAVMVSATAAISGGHLNPAVTVAAWITGKLDAVNAVGYVVAQCVGAVVAASLIKGAVPADVLSAVGMGTPSPGEGITVAMALTTEIVLTFLLVFVVFGTAIDPRAPRLAGLFIGLTVALDILMGGPISGAAMNPARHLGPALMGEGDGTRWIWLYWVGPVAGAVLAALFYHHLLEEKPVVLGPRPPQGAG